MRWPKISTLPPVFATPFVILQAQREHGSKKIINPRSRLADGKKARLSRLGRSARFLVLGMFYGEGGMSTGNKPVVLGFLTVRATERAGWRGGYLLTTEYGRPIEFHFTSEVRLSKQQQLLFGKDVESYLFAEVIGKPMTDRQVTAPRLIAVDHAALLELRRLIPAPVVHLVGRPNNPGAASPGENGAILVQGSIREAAKTLNNNSNEEECEPRADDLQRFSAAVHPFFSSDLAAFDKLRTMVPRHFDWLEPFSRLDAALAEVRDPAPATPLLSTIPQAA